MYCTIYPVCKSRLDDDGFMGIGSWSSWERVARFRKKGKL